jgi:predicted Zn-ribbon and HTH transcriptional regulator
MTRPHQVLDALFNYKEPMSVDSLVEQIDSNERKSITSSINHCVTKKWLRPTGARLAHNRVMYEITYFGRQRLKELQNDHAIRIV